MSAGPRRRTFRIGIAVLAAAAVTLLALKTAGVFVAGKVGSGDGAAPPPKVPVDSRSIMTVTRDDRVPVVYDAVGTIVSRDTIDVSPRITARIRTVGPRAGDAVRQGETLFTLEDTELEAGRLRAAEGLKAAEAVFTQAVSEFTRSREKLDQKIITAASFEIASRERAVAETNVASAREFVREAEAVLAYASVTAPMDGIVFERLADPGDMAVTGIPVMRVFDPKRLMLEAPIREDLVSRIRTGEKVAIGIDALGLRFLGEVREVVPSVDPGSMTFLVRICLGDPPVPAPGADLSERPPTIFPGMFGRLPLPVGTRSTLVIPEAYRERVGQVECVVARSDDGWHRRMVRTAPLGDGRLEILSGIAAGEEIALPAETRP